MWKSPWNIKLNSSIFITFIPQMTNRNVRILCNSYTLIVRTHTHARTTRLSKKEITKQITWGIFVFISFSLFQQSSSRFGTIKNTYIMTLARTHCIKIITTDVRWLPGNEGSRSVRGDVPISVRPYGSIRSLSFN